MSQATLDALRAREQAKRPVEKPKRAKKEPESNPAPESERTEDIQEEEAE